MIMKSPHPFETFYSFWALKESFIKGLGIGLAVDVKNLNFGKNEVSNQPPQDKQNWFSPKKGYPVIINQGTTCAERFLGIQIGLVRYRVSGGCMLRLHCRECDIG